MSIKQKIVLSFLSISLLIGLLGAIVIYHEVTLAETIAMNEANNIAKTFSLLVEHEYGNQNPTGRGNSRTIQRELQNSIDRFRDFQKRDVAIVDKSQNIIADTVKKEVGTQFTHDINDEVGQTLKDGQMRFFIEKSEIYPQGIKLLVQPINAQSGERIGAMILEYTPLYVEIMTRAKKASQELLGYYLVALMVSLGIGYSLARGISRQILSMKRSALKVAAGDLEARVEHRSNDELGLLANSFNSMLDSLKQSQNQLLQSNNELKTESELRKKSEQALLQSEQKFRTLFESANDGLFILDLQGNFIDINRTAHERLGYSREEMLAKHISQLDPPQFAAKVPERFALIQAQGWALFESAHLRKDGTIMPVEVNSRIMELSGKKVLFSAIRDITERNLAKDALKKTNARLQALIHSIPDMVFFKDVDGRYLIVNKALEEILGRTIGEILGKTDRELMPPGTAEACRLSDEKAMHLGAPTHSEEQFPGKDGATRYFEIVKAPIFDSQHICLGLVSIGRDITERKWVETELAKHGDQLIGLVDERTRELKQSNEKLLREISEREKMEAELIKAQKLESLGILAGGIAHDFNNLLTAVLGNISMALLDLDQEHPAFRQLAGAERASLRAQDLTQQLLTFSRGGAPVKRITSIGDLMREAAGFALRGSRTRCVFSLPEDLWLIDADEGQMSQVIHNLVINAEQAMPEGGTITLSCENAELTPQDGSLLKEGRYVKIIVHDTGTGIPKDHLPKIFDPYFTTKQKGSGLGLATTYAIIQKHSGSISVQSDRGAGAVFTIYLPASQAAELPKINADAKLRTATGKILIMDDEDSVRQTTGAVLQRLGYSVDFAEDGVRTIEKYREARDSGTPFDAVIMDLTIPGGMGGQEAIQRLLEIDPSVKAIVSSGYSNDPIMADFRTYGFSGVVTKPYRIKDLSETVSGVLSRNNP